MAPTYRLSPLPIDEFAWCDSVIRVSTIYSIIPWTPLFGCHRAPGLEPLALSPTRLTKFNAIRYFDIQTGTVRVVTTSQFALIIPVFNDRKSCAVLLDQMAALFE